jgi:hypothetical protein
MAYLTTRQPNIEVGSSANAQPILDHFTKWAANRNLNISGADVSNWETKI